MNKEISMSFKPLLIFKPVKNNVYREGDTNGLDNILKRGKKCIIMHQRALKPTEKIRGCALQTTVTAQLE